MPEKDDTKKLKIRIGNDGEPEFIDGDSKKGQKASEKKKERGFTPKKSPENESIFCPGVPGPFGPQEAV